MAKPKRRLKDDPKYRTKQSLKKKRRQRTRKKKQDQGLKKYVDEFIKQLLMFSFPDEGDAELCKARVASGKKCWCAKKCECRNCQQRRREQGVELCSDVEESECPEACKNCSNYKPCWK